MNTTTMSPQRLTRHFKGYTLLRLVSGFNLATCIIYIFLGVFYITYSQAVSAEQDINILIARVAATFLAMLAICGIVTSVFILRRYTVKALKKWSICYLIVSAIATIITVVPIVYINLDRVLSVFTELLPIFIILVISLFVPIYYLVQVKRYHKQSNWEDVVARQK